MTSRERITAVLDGREPDRVPFVPLVGRYYVKSLPAMGIPLESVLSEKAFTEGARTEALASSLNLYEVETVKFLGADLLHRHVMAYRLACGTWGHFAEEKEGTIYEGFRGPDGTLCEQRKEQGGTEYISRHMLESPEDLKLYRKLLDSMTASPYEREFTEFDEYIGEDGIPTLTGPVTPIQELLQFKMGVEKTAFALIDYPDLMEEIFHALHDLNREIYRILAASAARVTISYEDTSTTVMSPGWYEQYCAGELDDYSDILHAAGKTHIVHMCGKISLLTDLIAQGRMDGLDSVCPPTTGDLEPDDALLRTGKLIIGGLEPPALTRMTPLQCAAYGEERLERTRGLGPFMLSTGDSTAAGTPVDNLRAIADSVKTDSLRRRSG